MPSRSAALAGSSHNRRPKLRVAQDLRGGHLQRQRIAHHTQSHPGPAKTAQVEFLYLGKLDLEIHLPATQG